MVKMQDHLKSYKVLDAEFEKMNNAPTSNEFYDDNTRSCRDKIQDYHFDNEEQWYYNPVEIEIRCKEDSKRVVRPLRKEIKCKNIGLHHCNKYVHNIIDKMLSKKLRLCLFNWNDIPGKDSTKFKDFLKQCYGLDWLENLEFIKNNEEIISISDANHCLSLSIKNEQIILEIQDSTNRDTIKDEKYFIKEETDKKYIYFKYFKGGLFKGNEYPILNKDQCIQYIHEHVPFHLPQINQVIGDILLQRNIFDENQTINIMDIGSGPATVPLALCRLKKDELQNRKFKITTVEASEACNEKIEIFNNSNKNKPIYKAALIKSDILDFMKRSNLKMGYDWIIMANSFSSICKNVSEARTIHNIFNEFFSNILNSNKNFNYNRIILTIIEGKRMKFFDASSYLSNIENVVFNDFSVTPIELSQQYNGKNIDCEWIKNCEFYNYKHSNMYRPAINSWSYRLELKNE